MRYLGNKAKLMEVIDCFFESKNLKQEGFVFCDAFSGTGTVSEYYSNFFNVITNDNLYFSAIMAESKVNRDLIKMNKLKFCPFEHFNNLRKEDLEAGFITKNYSPYLGCERMYFSIENAMIIDTIRDTIEDWFSKNIINDLERKYLISCLIESVSKVANIAGVYGAYLKKWDSRALKKMQFIDIQKTISFEQSSIKLKHKSYNKTVNDLIDEVEGDILYLDPPYTKNKYTTQYHILETIAKRDHPIIKGITGGRDMSMYSGDFSNKYTAIESLEKIIRKAKFKYIVMSYNSDGIIPEDCIEKIFKRFGKENTFELVKIPYRRYGNSKTVTKEGHYETIFFIEKKEEYIVSSPFNYQGGKHDMIPFIKENMPNDFNCFYDIFGGGFNVGSNLSNDKVVYNDINFKVKDLVKFFYENKTSKVLKLFDDVVKKFELIKGNKEGYLRLREHYNKSKTKKEEHLFMLMMYGFQQQFRFNSKYEYNNPIGQSSYNKNSIEKVTSFSNVIKEKNIHFFSEDYTYFEGVVEKDDFVYIDPPYLITLGSYNDGKRGFNGWSIDEEKRLLDFLTRLNKAGIRFMLSNVLYHKDKKNELLINWIAKYNLKVIESDNTIRGRREVLIVNY